MSNHETDSEESYQSDDSDINFIPGYIMECPELGSSDDDSGEREDNNVGLAYIDEPLADEAVSCEELQQWSGKPNGIEQCEVCHTTLGIQDWMVLLKVEFEDGCSTWSKR